MKYEEIISHLTFDGGERETLDAIHEKLSGVAASARAAYESGDESFRLFLDSCASESGFDVGMLTLYYYIYFGEYTYEECKKHSLSDEIFFSIMRVYPAVSVLNFKQTGKYGFGLEIYRSFMRRYVDAKIFRHGRLEFELCASPLDFELDGRHVKKGDIVLNIHIPRDEPFDEELCEAAYSLAREFFKKHYNIESPVFICDSWLIDPWLCECLSEKSTILKFQRKFKILEVSDAADNAIGWIFGKKLENPNDYAEDTTIRRAAKQKLLAGERIGTALGARL